MTTTEKIKRDLFHYFEARGVVAGHIVNVTDFAAEMKPGYTPEELAGTNRAFADLVAVGVFTAKSTEEYILTAKGLALLRNDRAHKEIH